MSEGGSDPASLAIGAVVTGLVALVFAFFRGLFTRNVGAADQAQTEMRTDVKNILIELRSMHDEQTRQRAELVGLARELDAVKKSTDAAHARVDALVTPPPRGGGRK